jgi:ABC-type multidrug transport system permease subunit
VEALVDDSARFLRASDAAASAAFASWYALFIVLFIGVQNAEWVRLCYYGSFLVFSIGTVVSTMKRTVEWRGELVKLRAATNR